MDSSFFLRFLLFAALTGESAPTPNSVEGFVAPSVVSFRESHYLEITVSGYPFKEIEQHDCIYFQFYESAAGPIHTTTCLPAERYAIPQTCVKTPNQYERRDSTNGCASITFQYRWRSHFLNTVTSNPAVISVRVASTPENITSVVDAEGNIVTEDQSWYELTEKLYVLPDFFGVNTTTHIDGDAGYRVEAKCNHTSRSCSLSGAAGLRSALTDPPLCINCTNTSTTHTYRCVWTRASPYVHDRKVKDFVSLKMPNSTFTTPIAFFEDGIVYCNFKDVSAEAADVELRLQLTFQSLNCSGTCKTKTFTSRSFVPVSFVATAYGEYDLIEGMVKKESAVVLESYFIPTFIDWSIKLRYTDDTYSRQGDKFEAQGFFEIVRVVRTSESALKGVERMTIPATTSALELVHFFKRYFFIEQIEVWFSNDPLGGVDWNLRVPLDAGIFTIENVQMTPTVIAVIEPSLTCRFGEFPVVPSVITPSLVVCYSPVLIDKTETFPLYISYNYGVTWAQSPSRFHYFPEILSIFPMLVPFSKSIELDIFADGMTQDCWCIFGPVGAGRRLYTAGCLPIILVSRA